MVKQKLDIGFFSIMYSQINGTAHAVRFLSEAVAKTGHNVHVFAPKITNGYKTPDTLHFHSMSGARLSKQTGFVLSVPFSKLMFCPHDYLDAAHIHTHVTVATMAINWAKFLGIPMIGTHNSPLTFYTTQYVRPRIVGRMMTKFDFIWRFERHILNKYDLTHVATDSKKDLLRDQRFKEPIIKMTNGVNDYFYHEVKEDGIREKYGIPTDKKMLLIAGRMSPEKSIVSMVKEFKKIHKEVPDSHLVIAGRYGPSTNPALSMIKNLKLDDCCTMIQDPSFPDLRRLYKTADLSSLWSWVEAEGLVLLEAMAQGTPNVGAHACGIQDVIRHGQTGYLASNFDEYRKSVVKILKDDDLRAEMAKNAKKIAQPYRVSTVAKTWIELYKFTINQLYPLRYHNRDRRERVELVKEFVHKMPNITF